MLILPKREWPKLRAEEVCQNANYIVCGASVYDIEPILDCHPGGRDCLLRRGGGKEDCLRDFYFHSRPGKLKWEDCKIGELLAEEQKILEEGRERKAPEGK